MLDDPRDRQRRYRRGGRRTARFPALALAGLIVAGAGLPGAAASPAAQLDDYRTHEQLTARLQELAGAHADLARIESLGQSLEGRDVWLVELANREGTPLEERPGLLVVANLEGSHLVGSEIGAEMVGWLLESYGTDEAVTRALDEHVVWVVPRLNPDGAERYFEAVRTGDRRNARPYDDDNDARTDEDGPDDLNGDGMITAMRVEDPAGAFMVHPDDPRAMKRADPARGETGTHTLYREGLDDDGDGFYNEDGRGGVDLNRNFQHDYPYYEADAGPHMVSESEVRGLLDFVVAHRNIAAIYTFGETDNLAIQPPGSAEASPARASELAAYADASYEGIYEVGMVSVGRRGGRGFRGFGGGGGGGRGGGGRPDNSPRPPTALDEADVDYFGAVGERFREITGIDGVLVSREPHGSFYEYGYYQYGVPSFSTLGWFAGGETDGATASTRPEPSGQRGGRAGRGGSGDEMTDLSVLQAMDRDGVDGFVAWETFDHPTLGTVEIGGFEPYVLTNPPAEALSGLPDVAARHGAFVADLTSMFARIEIVDMQVTDQGGGIFRVDAVVANRGFLPTALAMGVRARSVNPVMVQLQIPPDDLVSGSPKTTFIDALAGSGSRESFTWVFRGQAGDEVELRVRTQKAGQASRAVTLQ